MFFLRKFKSIYNTLLFSSLLVTIICSNLSLSCNASATSNTISFTSTQSNQMALKTTPKFFKENCTCSTQWQCECCAKVNNDLLNVHQTLCADWTVFSNSWDIQANVRLNENVLYTNTFSAWNVPPFCVPIWPAIALTGCVQLHSITQHEFNTLHGCANLTINFIAFNLINFQMGCMDVGTGGIQFVDPNHDIVSTTSTEKPPEIELETSDYVKTSTPTISSFELNDKITTERTSTMRQDSLSYLKSTNF
ncbi:hypothetical protein FF38_03502 [Lucilia cuprina]|uniref:DUF4773 domain-containing protein n=1 Tax=Lucilia cuprina TaxID=7375 RepID=A0A0L0CIS2_LUCCU|nr:hypothetical protein FF38_03502 [Lucilia cuprina]